MHKVRWEICYTPVRNLFANGAVKECRKSVKNNSQGVFSESQCICNNINATQYSFACHCVDSWNFLPLNLVSATSINCSEAGLNTAKCNKFLKHSVQLFSN